MKREESIEEISDGRLYTCNDMVRADCQGCQGCSDCCKGMGDSVMLDPYDVCRLSRGLGKTWEQLLNGYLEIGIVDGNILPHLAMAGAEEACVFLNPEGRCSIHPLRPGFCRLFPLGRYYDGRKSHPTAPETSHLSGEGKPASVPSDYSEGGFHYILQVHECPKKNRAKIKVRKWLDEPDLKNYEKFVYDWHEFLLDTQEILAQTQDEGLIRNLNLYIISRFYQRPYEAGDFYPQFYRRLEEARQLLSLGL